MHQYILSELSVEIPFLLFKESGSFTCINTYLFFFFDSLRLGMQEDLEEMRREEEEMKRQKTKKLKRR